MPSVHDAGATDLSSRPVFDERDELDRRLLSAAARGDRAAFDALVERHHAAIHRFIRTLIRNDDAAEDALQETFLAAYRGAGGYRGEGRVRSWLLTIARNSAMRSVRAQPALEVDETGLDALGLEAGWGEPPDPERLAESSERRAALRSALAELSPEDRAVIVLHDLEGLSGPETAQVLGLPLAATKSRLHRARLRLLATLRRKGMRNA